MEVKVQNKNNIKHSSDMTPQVHHQYPHEYQTASRSEKQRRFHSIALFLMMLVIAPGAIGYSFHYDATRIKNSDAIWSLVMSDVALLMEIIRNGTYPFIKGLYIVTARPVSKNTQKQMDWFCACRGSSSSKT